MVMNSIMKQFESFGPFRKAFLNSRYNPIEKGYSWIIFADPSHVQQLQFSKRLVSNSLKSKYLGNSRKFLSDLSLTQSHVIISFSFHIPSRSFSYSTSDFQFASVIAWRRLICAPRILFGKILSAQNVEPEKLVSGWSEVKF